MSSGGKRIHPELFSLKYFEKLLFDDYDLLPSADDMDDLFENSHQAHLFLDYYSSEDILERLEHYGVLPKLKQKGFDKILVTMDLSDEDRQQIQLFDHTPSPDNLLGELALHPGIFKTESRYAGGLRGHRFHMLYIQWLCLQHPRNTFTAQRPALPGQQFPGLKVGREVMRMMIALAEKFKMDGILNVPEFPHAAVLYSRRFRFLNPRSEGILKAFQRDMVDRTLAQASWGITTGCVKDIATNEAQSWFKEEQVLPLSRKWKQHFDDPRYERKVNEVLHQHQFVFDEERWDEIKPLNADGSPKNFVD